MNVRAARSQIALARSSASPAQPIRPRPGHTGDRSAQPLLGNQALQRLLLSEAGRLLEHELTHVIQQQESNASTSPMTQEQEAPKPFDKRLVIHENIDVRAQFALLRLLRGSIDEATDAISMIEGVRAGTLKGIYGDDLGISAKIAAARQTVRWELVPKGQDAVWLPDDQSGHTPVIIFREGAATSPRLERSLLAAFRTTMDTKDLLCTGKRESITVPPGCIFTPEQKNTLDQGKKEAIKRIRRARELAETPGAKDLAEKLFHPPVPDAAEIIKKTSGASGALGTRDFSVACRTCGDPGCQGLAVVAYVNGPGQMPIFFCPRVFTSQHEKQVPITFIHEALHLSGTDIGFDKKEEYCSVFDCKTQCPKEAVADGWAHYINCLGQDSGGSPSP